MVIAELAKPAPLPIPLSAAEVRRRPVAASPPLTPAAVSCTLVAARLALSSTRPATSTPAVPPSTRSPAETAAVTATTVLKPVLVRVLIASRIPETVCSPEDSAGIRVAPKLAARFLDASPRLDNAPLKVLLCRSVASPKRVSMILSRASRARFVFTSPLIRSSF